MNYFLVWILVKCRLNFGQVPYRQTDCEAYEPTVQKHRCAQKCNLTLKWAHLPMPCNDLQFADWKNQQCVLCYIYLPLSTNTGTPSCFNIHYSSLQFRILAKCKLAETFNRKTHNFLLLRLSMDVTLRRKRTSNSSDIQAQLWWLWSHKVVHCYWYDISMFI